MANTTTRADFIKLTGLAGAGLALGFALPASLKPAAAADATPAAFGPSAWLRVDPAGLVTIMVNKAEMGQGVATSLPMMVAEELDVPMSAITTEFAPADAKYGDPGWGGDMVTGGSTSVSNMYMLLRKAGATARAMLVSAAAAQWNVPADALTTKGGMVMHSDGKRLAYGDLVAAASALPVPAEVTLKKPEQFTLIGTAVKRTDLVAKTNGTAGFGLDVKRPGMLIASIERPPAIGGKVAHLDATAAKKVKGVHQVVVVSSGVAVIADNMWSAIKGRKALKVTWDAGKNAQVSSATIDAMHRAALTKPGIPQGKAVGDVATAMKGAHKTVQATYSAPYLAHATMEPMNATALVTSDAVEVWAPNQVPLHARDAAAKITGLPKTAVTVHSTFLGGGFGRRLEHDYVIDAVEVAKAVPGKPVKVVWTREDDIRHDPYRSGGMNKLSGALDANGNLLALHHHATASSVTARWAPAFLVKGQDGYAVEGATPLVYGIPNFLMDWSPVDPGIPVGYWRAPGANVNTFATESFLDELAHAGGKDPVAFRRSLLKNNPRALAVLDAAVVKAKWGAALPKGHAHGVAMITWAGSIGAVIAEVSMPTTSSLKVHRLTMAADVGQPINTDGLAAQMQSAMLFGLSSALEGKITFKHGAVEQANFDTYTVLRMADVPEIDTVIIKSTVAPTGAGELGTPPVPAAVANAIFALNGKRIRSLPLRDALA